MTTTMTTMTTMTKTTKMVLHLGTAALAILATSSGTRSTAAEVEELLKREILSAVRPLSEVQRYCDARVPRMPKLAAAAQWEAEAERLRKRVLQQVVYVGKAAQWRRGELRVQWLETVAGGPGYRIKKLRFEAAPGMWIPALLYEPEKLSGKVPAILNVNGHSPEGKAYVPKQHRCINQAKRGMLALNVEWLGMGQLRTPGFNHASMNQLDLCGASGLAPFHLSMKRSLDLLLSLEHTDPDRVAVTGLSGGGWQTIFISALDTRVKLAVPVAGYSSYRTRTQHLKDLGDSEQTPNDLATLVDYTHLTAMMAPRPTLLTYNAKDNCCFEAGYALEPLLEAARPAFSLYGALDALRSHVNSDPGTHNYEQDNREALYRMLGAFFYPDDPELDTKEIPSDEEVKTAEELFVELPEKNQDFNSLALQLAADLPAEAELPRAKEAAIKWQRAGRARLAKIVRAKDYEVDASERASEAAPDLKASFWWLEMDDSWTVPAAVLEPANPRRTAVLIADSGRAAAAEQATKLLAADVRVVAIDPFCFGEAFPGEGKPRTGRGLLFPMLVAAVGDRPIGLQASQVAAAARWAAARYSDGPVLLVSRGPITGVVGLIAAALAPEAIERVELHESLGSLKQTIEENWSARETPELFCFGLLEAFDIKHLAALVAPRQVRFVAPSERVQRELAGLRTWYQTFGDEFDPIR